LAAYNFYIGPIIAHSIRSHSLVIGDSASDTLWVTATLHLTDPSGNQQHIYSIRSSQQINKC